jgi:hypothetical protein
VTTGNGNGDRDADRAGVNRRQVFGAQATDVTRAREDPRTVARPASVQRTSAPARDDLI